LFTEGVITDIISMFPSFNQNLCWQS